MPSEPMLTGFGGPSAGRSRNGRPSTTGRNDVSGSALVDGWSCSRRQEAPLARSTTMIPFGPESAESVMYATPASPRRRSKRTSLRYVVGSATSAGKVITWATVSVSRSIRTSFGPPGLVGWNIGLPVSSTQSRSAGSTTMLCTETNAPASSSPDGSFQAWSG